MTHRLPGATYDDLGNEIPEEESTETLCELQQTSTTEPALEGESSDSRFLLILPAGTLIATGDTVTIEGQDYELVGDPWRARNPRLGTHSHVQATVRRTSGTEDEGAS
ncbi:MAG: hypothetical protein ACXVHX_26745 [Solirubrobacteraceae bacterium]